MKVSYLQALIAPIVIVFSMTIMLIPNQLYAFNSSEFTHFDLSQFTDDQSNVSAIAVIREDANGFIWVGGENGLIKYTGQSAHLFRKHPTQLNTITGNAVRDLLFENNHILWIATTSGLSRLDLITHTFTNFDGNTPGIPGNNISSLVMYDDLLYIGTTEGLTAIDTQTLAIQPPSFNAELDEAFNIECLTIYNDQLWLGSTQGLARINLVTQAVKVFKHNLSNTNGLPHRDIRKIHVNDKGVWIASMGGGLIKYDVKNNAFSQIDIEILGSTLLSLEADKDGYFWIATNEDGLWYYNPESKKSKKFYHHPAVKGSVGSNKPRAIFKDSQDNLWVGMFSGMLNFYYNGHENSLRLRKENPLQRGLANSAILDLLEDGDMLWIGTEGGLSALDQKNNTIRSYNKDNTPEIKSNAALTLTAGIHNDIWMGTWSGGLHRYSMSTGQWQQFDPNSIPPQNPLESKDRFTLKDTISGDFIWALTKDDQGNLWVGYQTQGVDKINLTTGNITRYPYVKNNDKGIPWEYVLDIVLDKENVLWFGTQNGLAQYQPVTDDFKHYHPEKDNPNSLAGEQINTLLVTSNNELWIGTRNNGISVLSADRNTFTKIYLNQGLPSSTISAFAEDHQGNVWATTPVGVAYIPKDQYRVQEVYKKFHGLAGNLYNRNAALALKNRSLAFGGKAGLSIIQPELLKKINVSKPPVITGIEVNFLPSPEHLNKIKAHASDKIVLDYYQNNLGFEFDLNNYYYPRLNEFSYRLVGFDDVWRSNQKGNHIFYTNIPPGQYVFEVKGRAPNGIWGEAKTQVFLSIHYPPWLQWWANIIYVIVVLLALASYKRYLAIKATNSVFRTLSRKDTLTQLPNRTAINETIQDLENNKSRYCILIVDLDHFKNVNDTYGHNAGDEVLKFFSNTTKDLVNKNFDNACLGRWGGEEFIIIAPDISTEEAMSFSSQLRIAISSIPLIYETQSISITISVGIAETHGDETFTQQFQRADEALYEAKHNGRNQEVLAA